MIVLRYSCVLVPMSLVSPFSWAASYGALDNANLQSSATICMAIGANASISGLDDFQLSATDGDGSAGATYEGTDTFQLTSNAPVRVIIEGEQLSNGSDAVESQYSIDGSYGFFDTASEGSHSSEHNFRAVAQLGRISNQMSGDYEASVTLTVVPQLGGAGGCGEFAQGFSSNDGWVTLAYEDLYPSVGDGDYNDMVVRYHVEEDYNANQELESVTLQFEPMARGAGYNHSFNLSLDGEIDKSRNATTETNEAFVGDALISVSYAHENGNTTVKNNYNKAEDISVFSNTRAALEGFANVYPNDDWVTAKYTTKIEITLANPELNLYSDRGSDGLLWYRPFLSVNNTKQDIDLYAVNEGDGMIDSNGNPFGLLVPETWEWPLERVNINDAYPFFADYTRYLSGEVDTLSTQAETWYDFPASSGLVFNLDNYDSSD
jgi:LruC domain-containing protein